MTYEAYRITFQDSEQCARSLWKMVARYEAALMRVTEIKSNQFYAIKAKSIATDALRGFQPTDVTTDAETTKDHGTST